jgi:uncharacterized protein
MVEIPDIVYEKIKIFIDLLEENDIQIQRAYLFGSYVNGNTDEFSDIDLALISDNFQGNRYLDSLTLTDFILEAGQDISPLPFRQEDSDDSLFARDEIVKKGLMII